MESQRWVELGRLGLGFFLSNISLITEGAEVKGLALAYWIPVGIMQRIGKSVRLGWV